MGLVAGLTEREVMRSNPGKIIDLYRLRLEYDPRLFGFASPKKESDGDWD
jgi:hypothetical protein